MIISYSKLRSGDWGVRVQGARPLQGATLAVKTKAGATKSEVVERVIWSDSAGVTHLCAVRASSRPRSPQRGGRGRWNGCSCGARELPGGGLSANACASCQFDEYDC